jgi:hypothetical protein
MAQFLARRHCQITQRNVAGLCQKVRQLTVLLGWQNRSSGWHVLKSPKE